MEKEYFLKRLPAFYAIFGKKMPENPQIALAIWRQIGSLPPDFMDFAEEWLQDEEKMPGNLGKYLKQEVWPEYLEKNPGKRATSSFDCLECGGTGTIHAYRFDDSPYLDCLYVFQCECKAGDNGWTRQKIAETGRFSFTHPDAELRAKYRGLGPINHFRSIGVEDTPRPAHMEYMAEEVEF